jgi:hypothetical protein
MNMARPGVARIRTCGGMISVTRACDPVKSAISTKLRCNTTSLDSRLDLPWVTLQTLHPHRATADRALEGHLGPEDRASHSPNGCSVFLYIKGSPDPPLLLYHKLACLRLYVYTVSRWANYSFETTSMVSVAQIGALWSMSLS